MTALLTIFTTPKPFSNPHIAVIQRNALRCWTSLGAEVQVLAIGEEEGLAEAAAELGVTLVPQVRRNAQGTPLVSDIFAQARRHSNTPYLAYANADMLLLPEFVGITCLLGMSAPKFLAVGQRWDLDMVLADGRTQQLTFEAGWDATTPPALAPRAEIAGALA